MVRRKRNSKQNAAKKNCACNNSKSFKSNKPIKRRQRSKKTKYSLKANSSMTTKTTTHSPKSTKPSPIFSNKNRAMTLLRSPLTTSPLNPNKQAKA